MRTKVLLCAAAMAAACAFSAMAQNVYSLNVVGYINLPLMDNWNLVANQLDADGTGKNNTVGGVFGTNLPVGTAVSTWDPVAQNFLGANYVSIHGAPPAWDTPGIGFNPGSGAWVQIPPNTYGAGNTGYVTTVGQVLQGNLTNNYIAASGAWALLGNVVPIGGALQTVLNYQPMHGDAVSAWDPAAQNFIGGNYVSIHGAPYAWDTEPVLSVGQGFWLNTSAGSAWTTNFTVQ